MKACLIKLSVDTQRDLKASSQVGHCLEKTPATTDQCSSSIVATADWLGAPLGPDKQSWVFEQAKRVLAKQNPDRRNRPAEGVHVFENYKELHGEKDVLSPPTLSH